MVGVNDWEVITSECNANVWPLINLGHVWSLSFIGQTCQYAITSPTSNITLIFLKLEKKKKTR